MFKGIALKIERVGDLLILELLGKGGGKEDFFALFDICSQRLDQMFYLVGSRKDVIKFFKILLIEELCAVIDVNVHLMRRL